MNGIGSIEYKQSKTQPVFNHTTMRENKTKQLSIQRTRTIIIQTIKNAILVKNTLYTIV